MQAWLWGPCLLAALSTVAGEACESRATSLLTHQASLNTKVEVLEEKLAGKGEMDFSERQRAVMCYMKQQFASSFQDTVPPAAMGPNKTCAVVSNSGALLHFNYGQEINAHDVVMRFNQAEVAGYEKYVGNRTDVRTGWSLGKFEGEATAWNTNLIKWQPSDIAVRVLNRLYPNKLGVYHATVDTPTTGFVGMLVALSYCAVVDTYQMTPSKDASRSMYHYYNRMPLPANENAYHSFFKAEHDLWARLSQTPLSEVHNTGKTRTKGFSTIECQDSPPPVEWEPLKKTARQAHWWSLAGID